MKKNYQKPTLVVVKLANRQFLLTSPYGQDGGEIPGTPNIWD